MDATAICVDGKASPPQSCSWLYAKAVQRSQRRREPSRRYRFNRYRPLVGGLEVELSLPVLIEDALASGAAATHVHPIGRHDHDRPRTEIFTDAASGPVYQTPLIITFLISLLWECSGLSVPPGTLRICV